MISTLEHADQQSRSKLTKRVRRNAFAVAQSPKTAVFFPSQIALLTTELILSILNAVSKCTEKPVGRLLVY